MSLFLTCFMPMYYVNKNRGYVCMVRMLDFGADGHRLESHSDQDWKTLTAHPAVNGYLTMFGEGEDLVP